MCWAPIACAYTPVMSAARLGAHTGAVVNAFVKRTPSRASRSMRGVRATGSPYAPNRGLESSARIKTMLGVAAG